MLWSSAIKDGCVWTLTDSMGFRLTFEARRDFSGAEVQIGLLGTRRRQVLKNVKSQTELMVQMLSSVSRPLLLIDTRRNGVGGSGSWSPREFATEIPTLMNSGKPYQFVHIPALGPSIDLLRSKLPWPQFRDRYVSELPAMALETARALVEGACTGGGLAVFLCAEAYHPEFDSLSPPGQEEFYCHRFTLARCVAARLREAYPDVVVKAVHLDTVDYHEATGGYRPRTNRID